ncbi:GSCOCG00007608001-RA-CDS [Cotesia congregata]|nr:GSCOCG00007608001-RA-CDS [Cotesia congregata]
MPILNEARSHLGPCNLGLFFHHSFVYQRKLTFVVVVVYPLFPQPFLLFSRPYPLVQYQFRSYTKIINTFTLINIFDKFIDKL